MSKSSKSNVFKVYYYEIAQFPLLTPVEAVIISKNFFSPLLFAKNEFFLLTIVYSILLLDFIIFLFASYMCYEVYTYLPYYTMVLYNRINYYITGI